MNQFLDPSAGAYYHRPLLLYLRGKLNLTAFNAALSALVERQSVLRTKFPLKGQNPVQEILPPEPVNLTIYDLTSFPLATKDERQSALLQELQQPFDLQAAPPLRWALVKRETEEAVLIAAMHHILFDGWSSSIFQSELIALYNAGLENRTPGLKPLLIDYADYSVWQRTQSLTSEALARLASWVGDLSTLPAGPELHTDRGPGGLTHTATHAFSLSAGITQALHNLAHRSNCTFFMLLLTAYYALLCRWTGQTDVVVGVPVSGRSLPELEPLVGVFINPLPLRCHIDPAAPFSSLLAHVRQVCLDSFSRQDTPFEQIVEALNPPRVPNQPVLFQTLFQLRNLPSPQIEPGELQIEEIKLPSLTEYDLSVEIASDASAVNFQFHYNPDRLNRQSIHSLSLAMQLILESVLDDPQRKLEQLPLFDQTAREKLIALSRPDSAPAPAAAFLAHFAAQAARWPEQVAVMDGKNSITLLDLDKGSDQVAVILRQVGLQPGEIIAAALPRDHRFIQVALGVFKAGGILLPLDLTYPTSRLKNILAHSQTRFIFALPPYPLELLPQGASFLDLETPSSILLSQVDWTQAVAPAGGYLLYTSGTTGLPKGIRHGLAGLANAVQDSCERFSLGPRDRILQVSPLGYDVSLGDWGACLWSGATLVFAPEAVVRDPQALMSFLITSHASAILSITPSLLSALLDAAGEKGLRESSLRLAVMVGEPPSAGLCRRFYRCVPENAQLYNRYGPSEATQASTLWLVPAGDFSDPVPAGRPISAVSVWLLDDTQELVPYGAPGEIYLAGPHLAQGYFNLSTKSEERFIPNPHVVGGRLFRTGDRGRWNQAGELVVLGRTDTLVKIRGNRVELGEIEAALENYPGVVRAAVVEIPAISGSYPRLHAALLPSSGRLPDHSLLRDHLRRVLPEYMLPASFHWLDHFPLSPNGKIDHRQLKDWLTHTISKVRYPVQTQPEEGQDHSENDRWLLLSAIWRDLLEIPQIPPQESFFNMGGHSMLVLNLFTRVEQEFGIRLLLPDFIKNPTLAGQYALLFQSNPTHAAMLVELQAGLSDPPLYLTHTILGLADSYTQLLSHLPIDLPVITLQMPAEWQKNPPVDLPAMAAGYCQAIITHQPTGPIRLCGWSFGGLLALEIAAQITAAGRNVATLIIIDTDISRIPDYPRLLSWGERLVFYTRKSTKLFRWVISRYKQKSWQQRVAYLSDLSRRVLRRALRGVRIENKQYPTGIPDPLRVNMDINFNIQDRYQISQFPGPIHLLCATERSGILEPRYLGWKQIAPQVHVQRVPGDHNSIMAEPYVSVLAQALLRCLKAECEPEQ